MSNPLAKIKITYFKDNGKYYTDWTEERACQWLSLYSINMYEVVDWIRACRKSEKLPGLNSGTWMGYIHVDSEHGFPCLILPEE